jgi:hypothetical protein
MIPDDAGIGVTTGDVSIPFLWERHGATLKLTFANEPPAKSTVVSTINFEASYEQ